MNIPSIILLSLSTLIYLTNSQCDNRCATSWYAADDRCDRCCTSNYDCATGETCFSGLLNKSPCKDRSAGPPQPPATCGDTWPMRCGSTWEIAHSTCGTCCAYDIHCPNGELCFSDLSAAPCANINPSPTQPTTTITTAPTKSPTESPSTPLPTQTSNSIGPGNYPVAALSGCGTGPFVSLTFDDGPAEQNDATLKVIQKLNAAGIKATFYVSPAAWGETTAELTTRCNLIQQLVTAGNEIQSHSWTHPNFETDNNGTPLTNAQIQTQLDNTRNFITGCGGQAPKIFRPPFGALTKAQARYIVQNLGYIIGVWNLDTNDWQAPNDFSTISANIDLSKYNGNSINILMHDRNIYGILDKVIEKFENGGYTFGTQSQCWTRCDTKDSNGICLDPVASNNFWKVVWDWNLP